MRNGILKIVSVIIMASLLVMSGCSNNGEPLPSPSPSPSPGPPPDPSATFTTISNQIGNISTSSSSSLATIFGAILAIQDAEAEGTVTATEASNLENQLGDKFNSWIRETVDNIDPTMPESIKDFFDMQAVQRSSEYDDYVDDDTKQYKEEQMTEKFNQWVRNRVDEIDPSEEGALKDMFDLQKIQHTAKYDELATSNTKQYKEEQMGEKLNEWVRNRMDEIDPTDADSLKFFFWMQTVQNSEKYDEFATPETHEWKESEMKRKFNEWVENRVNDLDPNDPNFLEELEKLRVIQRSDKYDRLIATLMHQWKENTLKQKMDEYVENLVEGLNPLKPTFWEDLAKLIELQLSETYKEVAAKGTKDYKLVALTEMLVGPPGLPPTVVGIYPAQGQTQVPLDQPIMIVFDQPMELGSLEPAIQVSPSTLSTTATVLEENFIVLLSPVGFMAEDTTYTVTIHPITTSYYGIPLLEIYEFSFQTRTAGPAPTVTATSPQDGELGDNAGQPIVISFDQSMYTGSVEAALSISPTFEYSIMWLDDQEMVIQSHAPLDSDTTYTVTLGNGALSADGIALAEKLEFSFTSTLRNQPVVLGSLPAFGQSGIPSNHPIQIVFDRPMDTQSVETLLNISPNIEYSTTWYEADMVLEIIPNADLPANTPFTVTIDQGALSTYGLPMATDYSFNFVSSG